MDSTDVVIFREVNSDIKPFIDINYVSEIVDVPKDVLIYHIKENEDLVPFNDYINFKKSYAKHIGIRTIIYLTQFLRKDISSWQKVIEKMYSCTYQSNDYETKYNDLCKSIETLCINHNIIPLDSDESISCIDDSTEEDESNNVEVTKVFKKPKYHKNSKFLPTLTDDEINWQKNAIKNAKDKAAELDSTLSATLRRVYGRMTNVYGIVFDQEKKDIKSMFNIDTDEHMSTLYVITVSEQLRSLFDSILADLS